MKNFPPGAAIVYYFEVMIADALLELRTTGPTMQLMRGALRQPIYSETKYPVMSSSDHSMYYLIWAVDMQVSGRCVQYRCNDAGGPHGRCPMWGAERHDYLTSLPGARFRTIFGTSVKSM